MAGSGTVEDQAFVTLATNDSYALGALVWAHSLRQAGTSRKIAVMITSSVSQSVRHLMADTFDLISVVDVLDSRDTMNLDLLTRPDLGVTFTKLHCWRLTQFSKCVFMDADTLVLQNIDELFDREELSAAPDAGWPDCFNSGVFVYVPSETTYKSLLEFAVSQGSFDGGDQGLLNMYFRDWAYGDIAKHLPFIYNVVSQAFYSYLPAFKQFGRNVKVAHFIGALKPWHHSYNTSTGQVQVQDVGHHLEFLQRWWNLFMQLVQPKLGAEVLGIVGGFAKLRIDGDFHAHVTYDDPERRFAWERGQIDYKGVDSFSNIQKRLDMTILGPPPPVKEPEISVPVPEPVKEPEPAPVVEPEPVPVAEPAPAPVAEPEMAPAAEPETASTPVAEPEPTPVAEPVPSPVAEPEPAAPAEPAPAAEPEVLAEEAKPSEAKPKKKIVKIKKVKKVKSATDPASPTTPTTPEPAPAKVAEPAPAKIAEPAPAKVAEPAPAKVAAPAPVPKPAPAQVPKPAPAPVTEPAPATVSEPAPAPPLKPVAEPEPAPAPVAEPKAAAPAEPAAVAEEAKPAEAKPKKKIIKKKIVKKPKSATDPASPTSPTPPTTPVSPGTAPLPAVAAPAKPKEAAPDVTPAKEEGAAAAAPAVKPKPKVALGEKTGTGIKSPTSGIPKTGLKKFPPPK